jgi:hypothetical protein
MICLSLHIYALRYTLFSIQVHGDNGLGCNFVENVLFVPTIAHESLLLILYILNCPSYMCICP